MGPCFRRDDDRDVAAVAGYFFDLASRSWVSLSSSSFCWLSRSAMRDSFRSPEAAAACSINCRMLSSRILIRSLSSAGVNELSLLMMHAPEAAAAGWAKQGVPTFRFRQTGCWAWRKCAFTHPTIALLRLLRRLQHGNVIRHRRAAHVEDAGEFGVLELHALGRLADELHRAHHVHGDAGCADRVPLGLEATGRIDRQLAVLLGPAFLDGAGALAAR